MEMRMELIIFLGSYIIASAIRLAPIDLPGSPRPISTDGIATLLHLTTLEQLHIPCTSASLSPSEEQVLSIRRYRGFINYCAQIMHNSEEIEHLPGALVV
jgi:hypothetical protein